MGLKVAGIQPGYLPWLGCFDQMRAVDLYLVADQLPFSRSGWVHRNRVLGPNGPFWLRLPYRASAGERIDRVELDGTRWHERHERSLRQAYARSPFAAREIDQLMAALDPSSTLLADVATASLLHLAGRLGISTPIVRSSELDLEARYLAEHPDHPSASHQIASYLEQLGADELLEGASGRAFLDVGLLGERGIQVAFHEYRHPTYAQRHDGFVSHLSAVDLLLTHGAEAAARIVASS